MTQECKSKLVLVMDGIGMSGWILFKRGFIGNKMIDL